MVIQQSAADAVRQPAASLRLNRGSELTDTVSIHALSELDKDLVGFVNANQAHARELEVQDHIHRKRHNRCESYCVDPASVLVDGHTVSNQQ